MNHGSLKSPKRSKKEPENKSAKKGKGKHSLITKQMERKEGWKPNQTLGKEQQKGKKDEFFNECRVRSSSLRPLHQNYLSLMK